MNRRQFVIKSIVAAGSLSGEKNRAAGPSVKLQEGLKALRSPVLFAGDARTAYRDPAAVYQNGTLYLFFTLMRREGNISYSFVAWSKTTDLRHWSPVRILTPRNKELDYGSPGDVVPFGGDWVMCIQTYPRPQNQRYGNEDARIWTIHSKDLQHWSPPQLLRVKGLEVSQADMGRMIDPFLFQDKSIPGKWWCFYKQNGISMSYSNNLQDWTYVGHTDAGENPCVIVDRNEYVLYHSPPNGIGVKRSDDLVKWRDEGTLTLGQRDWPWASGRLTAGFVLDLRLEPSVRKALMFFHGSAFPEDDPRGGFDTFASLGIAWSDDLGNWSWPS
jgi:hypothetical protein